jgi:hypothetical protein
VTLPRLRILTLLLLAVAVALAISGPASATPTPTRQDLGSIPYTATADCNPYGLNFQNQVRGVESLFIETFYDSQGTPTTLVVHDSFQEADTNSVTGKTLSFAGTEVDTYDLKAGTRTVDGREFLMTDPGVGIVIHDTGRVVFSAPDVVSFAAGQHQVLYGDINALACRALAA